MQILRIGKVMWSHDYDLATLGLANDGGALFAFTPPPHHYNGEIILTPKSLVLDGDSYEHIPLDSLEQLYLGFDELYKRSMVRNNGLFWQPLRLRYRLKEELITLYLIVDHTLFGAKNQLWFNTLKQLLSRKA
ncbi:MULTISPECIES: hypothetical protein [Mucilaginibacter]|uniref:Uncharacterized protein n=2 Tax=Mucilaginibacter TaxID=423349 RepID=A0AAE6JFW4_9SPHI|nr:MULTISPECIES: hypothetical protein [Mucilaginibacter]NVM62582.1 hypothetical protein [Mucilaginibacter sp. SG538B]QEM04828.1 hypothetical protein DIU31_015390 [Mucilaginibacter rubeus]QEM17421.1 hypothetical protein DIU38_015550 [Mucilaginibacter gossypii]QTE37573.1 hypothetical protein J3L18_00455 [Mucilaginibacter gossypii]QTE46058.1 hypothetical protein J3L19_12125 [Mucilaginibacter rubeus]